MKYEVGLVENPSTDSHRMKATSCEKSHNINGLTVANIQLRNSQITVIDRHTAQTSFSALTLSVGSFDP